MQVVAARGKKETDEKTRTRRVVFLLLDRFTMISFAGAIEPLRIANRMLGRPAYSWILAGENGKEVRCSNGVAFRVDVGLSDLERDDMIFVCGGIDIQQVLPYGTPQEVREHVRHQIEAAGTEGGYIICTAHNLQPDTPLENALALFEAYEEFG